MAAALTAGLGAVAMAAAVAWACTGQPLLSIADPVAAPGKELPAVVRALDQSRSTAVDLRWNGMEGPVVASAVVEPGRDLTVPVRVPEVSPGVYYLVLVTDGQGVGRAAVQVTGSSNPGTSAWARAQDNSAPGPANNNRAFAAGGVLLVVGLAGLGAFAGLALKRSRIPADASTTAATNPSP